MSDWRPNSRMSRTPCSGIASSTGRSELRLDIPALKRETLPRVGFLPGAEAFLRKLRASGKRVVLVTNSHPDDARHQE